MHFFKINLVLFLGLLFFSPLNSYANTNTNPTAEELASSREYGRKVFGMLVTGINRVVTSPGEFFEPVKERTNKEYAVGFGKGVYDGARAMAIQAVAGAIDMATAAIPGFNGIARENAESSQPITESP